ncbi:hypothetical protein ALC56_02520 [Trachymyrmex septentrionalis]|uniref:Uncharacterized protein n=1 Tax=Trachymyrmex septentrionalis TaxID=34720 RepID=A0A151K0A7_9HYME|nr:hypothetical protein ALC56_02520 [Trachymyrmex septentrionalis]
MVYLLRPVAIPETRQYPRDPPGKILLRSRINAYQQFTCAFAIPPITCNNPGPETHNTTAGFPE